MARAGVLSPSRGARREYRFSFQDLVLLRSARGLLEARVPPRRVHRTLRLLVRQLPDGRRPSEVQLSALDGRIVARDGDVVWAPESGQMLLPFTAAEATEVTELPPPVLEESPGTLVNFGRFHQDRGDLLEAIRLYRAALDQEPEHAIAHFNLATALDASGDPDGAIQAYRQALAHDPGLADAHYNLSLIYQRTGHKLAALMHLKRYRELVGAD